MKNINRFLPSLFVFWMLLYGGCFNPATFTQLEVSNPAFINNTLFIGEEDLMSSRLDSLKYKYQLDTLFKGETDEMKRILMLRHWIKSKMLIGETGLYNGDADPEKILDAAAKGETFHCGHYMIVQNAFMNAYGYVTRCLGSGPGESGRFDQHHAMNEIWVGTYGKWFMCDAKYDHHFEKNGIPLSALEIRAEYLKNKGADALLVRGVDRTPVNDNPEVKQTKEQLTQTYTWLEWERSADRFTRFPRTDDRLIMYHDDYSRNHVWLWGGKPHWALKTDLITYTDSIKEIEWTPNTIRSQVTINQDNRLAHVQLFSQTPGFLRYEMRSSIDADWKPCDAAITLSLAPGRNEWVFHTVNGRGITGTDHRVVVAPKRHTD